MAAEDAIMLDESDYEEDFFDEDSDFEEENAAPVVKKAKAKANSKKKAPGAKTKKSAHGSNGSTILAQSKNAGNIPKTGKSKKTVEQIYQKKSQLEHILLRPDTYSKSPRWNLCLVELYQKMAFYNVLIFNFVFPCAFCITLNSWFGRTHHPADVCP